MTRLQPLSLRFVVLVAGVLPAAIVLGHGAWYELSGGRVRDNEVAVAESLRAVAASQGALRLRDLDRTGTRHYSSSLRELGWAGRIDDGERTGTFSGYRFSLSGDTFHWECSATPLSGRQGRHNFLISTDGVVRRGTDDEPATISHICQ